MLIKYWLTFFLLGLNYPRRCNFLLSMKWNSLLTTTLDFCLLLICLRHNTQKAAGHTPMQPNLINRMLLYDRLCFTYNNAFFKLTLC